MIHLCRIEPPGDGVAIRLRFYIEGAGDMPKRKRKNSFLFERTRKKHRLWWVPVVAARYNMPGHLQRNEDNGKRVGAEDQTNKAPMEGKD